MRKEGGKMLRFENPAAFALLTLIPVYFVLRRLGILSDLSLPLTLSDWSARAGRDFRVTRQRGAARLFLAAEKALCVLFYVFLVIALARPVMRREQKIYHSPGASIVFVLDVSPSMAARDIDGQSRLEAAKAACAESARENEGAAFGLVEMAGSAAVLIPPTADRAIFASRLAAVKVGDLGDGSAIGDGISCAARHLEGVDAPRRAVVLITDGENNTGTIHPHTAAEALAARGISLYVLGVGTRGFVPIEYTDPETQKSISGYLRSDFDAAALAEIASAGGGKFFGIEGLDAFTAAVSSINEDEYVSQSYRVREQGERLYARFLLAACGAAALLWFIRRVILREAL